MGCSTRSICIILRFTIWIGFRSFYCHYTSNSCILAHAQGGYQALSLVTAFFCTPFLLFGGSRSRSPPGWRLVCGATSSADRGLWTLALLYDLARFLGSV
ncbi:hypothetical protein K505DRAFT_148164 [Melanomma pulvis-pyrius CBS 109.77]|uniref:Uncharacterized protein n=1 Tax=Melanomma pulvis-pyrius CBS 109.77 TaxID=1314802 RepID=A0A6A6WQE5_9PLEO|nr:hypothetical protein K505DRAFT_148164 [Melanomma pulvis-pyrius CBS 109.77]